MRIAILQLDIVHGNIKENIKRVSDIIDTAVKEYDPQLIALPETWNTGYSTYVFQNVTKFCETKNGPSLTMLKEKAKQHSVFIVGGSISEEINGKIYNSSNIINNEGKIIGSYQKTFLYSDKFKENEVYNNGTQTKVIETILGKFGIMICYDLRFCELSRLYALKGAQILFVPSNFPKPKLETWRTLLTARAIENQIFVIGINRAGSTDESDYFGHSIVISPSGNIISEAGSKEQILFAEINFNQLYETREKLPVYKDLKDTHLWKKLQLLTMD